MFRFFSLFGLLMFGFVTSGDAATWRGIVPLHSSRAEVERLLGTPNGKYGRYDLENEEVEILYSTGRCANGWDVPKGIVIDISVHPKRDLRLSNLNLDLAKYTRIRDPHVPSHVYYANREEGIRYVIYEGDRQEGGKVLTIYYESTLQDVKRLSCPSARTSCQKPRALHYPSPSKPNSPQSSVRLLKLSPIILRIRDESTPQNTCDGIVTAIPIDGCGSIKLHKEAYKILEKP